MLQTAAAAELHAAWGVLVSDPLQAPRSKETEIEARMRRMQEPSRLSGSFESQLSATGDGRLNSWVVGAQSDSARLSLPQPFRQPLRRRARVRQRWQAGADSPVDGKPSMRTASQCWGRGLDLLPRFREPFAWPSTVVQAPAARAGRGSCRPCAIPRSALGVGAPFGASWSGTSGPTRGAQKEKWLRGTRSVSCRWATVCAWHV